MKKLFLFSALIGFSAYSAEIVDVQALASDGFGGEVGSVLSRCQVKVGDAYDPLVVTRDVAALTATGEFEEVKADAQSSAEGVAVVFVVRRKPRYNAPLVVEGCEFFDAAKISKEAELKDGYFYGDGELAEAASRVMAAYRKKGFNEVKVTPVVRQLEGSIDCAITFVVKEGVRGEIGDYRFEGVVGVEVSELRAAIGDFPWWNPIGWFQDRPTTAEQLAQSVDRIAEVYRNQGFLDVKVAPARREPNADGLTYDWVFSVKEGMRYEIGKSTIEGLTKYPVEAVVKKSDLPAEGAIAGEATLNEAAHRVQVVVGSGNLGLADTRVAVVRIPSETASNRLDIVYRVVEGVPVVVDDVVIRGNDYTKDKVIRREIALGPGDLMLADRAERSQRKLERLDYFSRVRYSLEPSGRGKDGEGREYRNLVYEVEEKNTGAFMFGVGASSVDSIYVSAEVSQSNFDLFAPDKWFRGGGQKGRAYVQWGPRIQTMELSVTEPHLFDRYLELTVEGYRRGRWYDEYDLYRTGADASLSYPVKFWPTWEPFGRFGFRLSSEFISFDDVDNAYYTYKGKRSQYFREQEREYGDAMEAVLRVFWNHDNRNDFRIPTTGSRTQVFGDLGCGDNSFWRLGVNHRHYFNTWKRYNHVFMVGLRAETIDAISDEVPIYNRMFLGGPRSIRGVKYRNVSPLIRRDGHNDYAPIGGQTLFCVNLEYTIPIVKMLRLAVFSDLGSIGEDAFDFDFGDNFAWTGGVGIRLDLPMFPIRLDFAAPFVKGDDAESEVFSFTIGYDF